MDMSYIAQEVNEDQLRAKGFTIKPDKFGNAALALMARVSDTPKVGDEGKMEIQANHDKWVLRKACINQARMIDVTGGGNTIVFFAVISAESAKWELLEGRGLWSFTTKGVELRQAVASNLTIKECPALSQTFIQELEHPVFEVPDTGHFTNAFRLMFGMNGDAIHDAAKIVLEPVARCFTVSFPLVTIPAN